MTKVVICGDEFQLIFLAIAMKNAEHDEIAQEDEPVFFTVERNHT